MNGTIIRYGLIGTGWRSEFYLRIARALPERFAVSGVVSRRAEKRAAIQAEWGVPTFADPRELLHAAPDFVVVSVNRAAAVETITELAACGVPVLTETPAADGMAGLLALHRLETDGALIQVAEQYARQPMHAARLAVARSGKLGSIGEAQVSFSHGYHGVALMRALLGVSFETARIRAFRYPSRFVAGPGRNGLTDHEEMKEADHDIALFDFGGKLGVYDFATDQHRSYTRSSRILVRGDRGEINGTEMRWVEDFRTPLRCRLTLRQTGLDGNLEGYCIRGVTAGARWVYQNPFQPARLSEEEIAVASCLQGMADRVSGESAGYPLAQALQDRYLDLKMAQAIQTGTEITADTPPWAES